MTTTPTPTPGHRPTAADTSLIPGGMEIVGLTTHVEGRSGWEIFWKRFRRHKLGLVGAGMLSVITLASIFGPMISPYTFNSVDVTSIFEGPSWKHPFGTAELGQDELTRVLMAGRISLLVGLMVALLATVVGGSLGLFAGYFGGPTDSTISRITDMFLAVPALVVIIAIGLTFSTPGLWEITFLIFLFSWMALTRIIRGSTLSLKEREFVLAARAVGASRTRIIFRHILPNVIAETVVFATITVAVAILTEAAVSFLGFGLNTEKQPSWGSLLSKEPEHVLSFNYAWLTVFPGLMIVLTVLAVSFLGDALRDALDPHAMGGSGGPKE
jgi:peptide/nickel transport system permease protein